MKKNTETGFNQISVLTIGHTQYIIAAFHEVIKCLKSKNITVNHLGISPDLWNFPKSLKSSQVYQNFNYQFCFIPRISRVKTPCWQTNNISKELNNSLHSIADFLDNLVGDFQPDIVLIADDWGAMEVFILEYFNWKQIPVLFLEHAPSYVNIVLTNNYQIKNKTPQDWKNKQYHVPQVNPPGTNADYLICSFCQSSEDAMIKLGVKPFLIRKTGFPYFDSVYRNKMKIEKKSKKPRILIVSNGAGLFSGSYKKHAANFYTFIIHFIYKIQNDYDIYFRFKPGEKIKSFLEPESIEQFSRLKIRFDDNNVESYLAIQQYDLVIGDTSAVLLESIILDIPIVLISLEGDPLTNNCFDHRYFLQDIIGVLTISACSNFKNIIDNALSKTYLHHCSQKFMDHNQFYHKIDGRISERVCHVIVETIVNFLYKKELFAKAYNIIVDANKKFPNSDRLLEIEANIKSKIDKSQNTSHSPFISHNDGLNYNFQTTPFDSENEFARQINMLNKQNNFESAKNVIERGIQQYPNSINLLNLKAENKVKTGNLQEAKKILLDIIKQSPDQVEALNNLGVIEFYEKNFNSANEFFKNALIIDPSYESSLFNLECLAKLSSEKKSVTSSPSQIHSFHSYNDKEYIVYFGHHKCATTWIAKILREISKRAGLSIADNASAATLKQLKISDYNIICDRSAVKTDVDLFSNFNYHAFHVIRDPRDVIVSGYFSHKKTHPVDNWPRLIPHRIKLNCVSLEEGIKLEMDFSSGILQTMHDWDYNNPRVFETRFEKLTIDPLNEYIKIFTFLGLYPHLISNHTLQIVIDMFSFKRMSKGRKIGEEDASSHYRKGVPGDWVNYIYGDNKLYFKDKFGQMLIDLGYENNYDW